MYITTHHKKFYVFFLFFFFMPLSSYSSCFKCYKEAKYSLSCGIAWPTSSSFHPRMSCSSLASVSLKIYALLNDKKKCITALCPRRPFGVWRTLTPSHWHLHWLGGERAEGKEKPQPKVLSLRQCFLCFIDGVNTAPVPSPASEDTVEVRQDEGMRPHLTSTDPYKETV